MIRAAFLALCCLYSATVFAQQPAPPPAPAQIPVEDFARSRDFETAKISPLGEYLAVTRWQGNDKVIAILDAGNLSLVSAMKYGASRMPYEYWWVGPRTLITEVAMQEGPLDLPQRTGELLALDAGGASRFLFGYGGKRRPPDWASAFVVDPSIGVDDEALIAIVPWRYGADRKFPQIERIEVRTGKRHRLLQVPLLAPQVLADKGQPRFAVGNKENGDCCVLMARATPQSEWKTAGASGEDVDPVTIDSQGLAAYFSSSEGGKPSCLREYRFADDSFRQLHCNGTVDVNYVLASAKAKQPAALIYEDGKPVTAVIDTQAPETRALRSLQASFPGQRVQITSMTRDGGKMVALVDSDRNPGDYYVYDVAAAKARYVMSRRSWIDPAAMAPMEPIRYQTRDGATIHGYLTARGGLQTRNAPLVLLPHGGPFFIRDYWKWQPDVQLLASRGYSVLQVNYRGSGGYGLAHQEAGYRKWGTLMQDDLTDAVRWAIQQGIADPQRVCIYGASWGGYAALMSAAREPALYRCAASFAGVSDLEIQIEDSDTADHWLGRSYLKKMVGDDDDELAAQSPVTHAASIQAAVFIAHGIDDKRVPFSHAKAMRKALKKHGKPFEWAEYKGEQHGLFKDENKVDFYNRLLAFLDKHIGEKAAPAQ